MSDLKFSSWSVAESPIVVEYSLVVLEEIRHEVAEGFQRLSRGGIEVGGVLYGTREARTVRIQAMRPIACEHARGPAFLLSDKDRAALHEQLTADAEDPRLEGLISVGWFLSHTRSEIALTESDLEIFSIFFPAPWQVTMVVRPGRGGSMRAGFFVREADATVKNQRSYLEFNFPDRLAGVLDRAPGPRPERVERKVPNYFRADTSSAAAAEKQTEGARVPTFGQPAPAPDAGPHLLIARPPRRRWIWLVAWVVVLLALAVAGLRYWMPVSQPASDPLSLALVDHDGQVMIQWNPASKSVKNAARGSLQIMDGTETRTVALKPMDLAGGRSTYVRRSGDVEVRLTVEDSAGARVQEASRFLGRPPAAVTNLQEKTDLEKRRNELEAEVARLRQANQDQALRIQTLERTLRILQTRLGIVDQGKQ
jgi:proteasome lid subunit RPN8/RPN11